MSQCQGFFADMVPRDRQSSGQSRPCKVTVSNPSPDWCQFTITRGRQSARLSIPMTEFFGLVQAMDAALQEKQEREEGAGLGTIGSQITEAA